MVILVLKFYGVVFANSTQWLEHCKILSPTLLGSKMLVMNRVETLGEQTFESSL